MEVLGAHWSVNKDRDNFTIILLTALSLFRTQSCKKIQHICKSAALILRSMNVLKYSLDLGLTPLHSESSGHSSLLFRQRVDIHVKNQTIKPQFISMDLVGMWMELHPMRQEICGVQWVFRSVSVFLPPLSRRGPWSYLDAASKVSAPSGFWNYRERIGFRGSSSLLRTWIS